MPRDLPLSNGRLLVNFDKNYNLRDIYWPHVGQEIHTAGDVSHTGVWVSGQFAWLDAPEWRRELVYDDETLATSVMLEHPALRLQLVFNDVVDFDRPLFLRHMLVKNLADTAREVRLFFHYDWHIADSVNANTVFYYPYQRALVAYRLKNCFLMSGQVRNGEQVTVGISSWATGVKEFHGAEGTWRDAENGDLGRNPIAQGSVDGTIALHLPPIEPGGEGEAYHWLAVGEDLPAVVLLDNLVRQRGPQAFMMRTRHYWHLWVNKDVRDFADLSPALVMLYKRSLIVLRTQIDHAGAILAANDADVQTHYKDSYSYMWPRDGALAANALNYAGYADVTRGFYDFCTAVLTDGGYLLHKYNPDRSWGSSWEAWVDSEGQPHLPIQEDETALVLYSLWQHYQLFHDIEFVAPHFRTLVTPAADFMVSYRESHTGLPRGSYDLWEERRGILTYTTATVYAGLQAAANFATIFGEMQLAVTYQRTAQEIKEAALRHLWDEEEGHFLRMITVDNDGTISRDTTLDSSVCGLFQFGMLAADDPRMIRTIQAIEQSLWVKTEIGGVARYENDTYYQVTQDRTLAQGNPWFICTLWLAQYRIARASTLAELHQAIPLMEWALKHALPSGVMAEQIHPFTGEPLSVSPLTWSHAEFIMTVHCYQEQYRKVHRE